MLSTTTMKKSMYLPNRQGFPQQQPRESYYLQGKVSRFWISFSLSEIRNFILISESPLVAGIAVVASETRKTGSDDDGHFGPRVRSQQDRSSFRRARSSRTRESFERESRIGRTTEAVGTVLVQLVVPLSTVRPRTRTPSMREDPRSDIPAMLQVPLSDVPHSRTKRHRTRSQGTTRSSRQGRPTRMERPQRGQLSLFLFFSSFLMLFLFSININRKTSNPKANHNSSRTRSRRAAAVKTESKESDLGRLQ